MMKAQKNLINIIVIFGVFALSLFISYKIGGCNAKPKTVIETKTAVKYIDRERPKVIESIKTVPVVEKVYIRRVDTLRISVPVVKEIEKPIYLTTASPVEVKNPLFSKPTIIFTGFRPDSLRWEQKVYEIPERRLNLAIVGSFGVLGEKPIFGLGARIGFRRVELGGSLQYSNNQILKNINLGVRLK